MASLEFPAHWVGTPLMAIMVDFREGWPLRIFSAVHTGTSTMAILHFIKHIMAIQGIPVWGRGYATMATADIFGEDGQPGIPCMLGRTSLDGYYAGFRGVMAIGELLSCA